MKNSTVEDKLEGLSWSWAQAGALATVALLGVLGGRLIGPGAPVPPAPPGFALEEGRTVARGEVHRALSSRTSGAAGAGPVAVQLSFVDTRGIYCRSFSTAAQAGLACRDGADWVVHLLVDVRPAAAGASLAPPPALVAEIDRRIVGAALDAKAEADAMERGWER